MNTPGYIKLLSREERMEAIKRGAALACFNSGIAPSAFNKRGSLLDAAEKFVLYASVIGGIPLGAAAHIIGRKLNKANEKERELTEQLKQYRATTSGLETGLAAPGTVGS